jgi:hypothetical protein
LPRDHARQWRRATDPYLFYSNVCDEGQSPAAGICTFSALLESECSLFSSPKTKPNRRLEPPPFSDLPTATCATNAVHDTLSGRLAARSRAAVAASNQPISIPTSAMRVKTPPRGFVPSAPCWNPNVFSFLLQNQTQTDASSRHHFPFCRPRHSDVSFPCSPTARSACRAITRGSGGEHSTHIYSIPTSAMRDGDPPSGEPYLQRLVGIRMFSLLFSKNKTKPTPRAATIFRSAGRAILTFLFPAHPLRGRLAARSRAAVAASIRPISIPFQRLR